MEFTDAIKVPNQLIGNKLERLSWLGWPNYVRPLKGNEASEKCCPSGLADEAKPTQCEGRKPSGEKLRAVPATC